MVSTDLTMNEVEVGAWEAVVADARSHDTSVGVIVTEAIDRYLEDAADIEAADRLRHEGGRIPLEFGRRLFLASTDEEAAAIEEEIAAYEAGRNG